MSENERLAVGSPASVVQAEGQSASPVFVRDATGLVKNVSFFDSIALNLSNMSIGALLGLIGLSGLLPMLFVGQDLTGVNLVYLSVIGFLVAVPQIVIYTVLTRRYPRAGGDYVFVSRNLGGFVGSVASFVGYTTETTAYLALIALSTVFAIGGVGLFFSSSSSFYLGLATPQGAYPGAPAAPSWQFVIGILIFAILIGINIVRPKAGYRVVSILTIVGIVALLTAIGTYLAVGPHGVQNYINGVTGNGLFTNSSAPSSTYANVAAGINTGGPGGSTGFAWGPTIFLLPLIAAFVFPWLNAAPAVAGEIKGKSALRWNVPISAVLAFAFLIGSIGVMYWAGGQQFINGAFSTPAYVYGMPVGFNFWTLAMGLSGNSVVAAFIGLGWIFANLGILAYGIIVISRYLLAQSFDRFLPSTISDVNPRFGSPVKAFIISLVVSIFLVGYAAYNYTTSTLGAGTNPLFGAILASMIYFMIVGLAAIVHGIRKETGIVKVILPLAGVGNILVFGFIAYQFLAYQSMWSINSFTFSWLIGCLLLGIVLFVGSYYYNKARGVNINLAYKEIPPE
ncbi:MAG: amino acid permease [Nitrososphaerota archaeon]|nr:amino acid permease [Nitrososphaerota archaeon]